MSNADRLRSGHGLPTSEKLVDIGPVEQQAPSTSSQPSLAHPSQLIRSDTRRYTQQGAAFQNRIMSSRQPSRHPLRNQNTYKPQFCGPSQSAIAYKKNPSTGPAHHIEPSERPDVHIRRQHPPNPGSIRHGRVPPTHATHSKPHYKPDFKTQRGQCVLQH
jgi:hypothetical protein